jgi:hypothetical protein
MRVRELAGKTIAQYNSPNVGGVMTMHRGIVLHIAQGSYAGTVAWQMNPDQKYADGTQVTTSSTFVVGRGIGEWAQMADSDTVAWCQRSGSKEWLSIELAGYAPNPPTAWQIEACAQLLAWAHRTYSVPLQSTSDTSGYGLGHHSMDNDTTVQWGHDGCPGTGVIAAKGAIVARALEIQEEREMDANQASQLNNLYLAEFVGGESCGRKVDPDGTGARPASNSTVAKLDYALGLLDALLARPVSSPAPVDMPALLAALRPELEAAAERAVRKVAADAAQ